MTTRPRAIRSGLLCNFRYFKDNSLFAFENLCCSAIKKYNLKKKMCSTETDIEELAFSTDRKVTHTPTINSSICKKCNEKSVLLLQKKDPFCKKCFFEYCDHKFRSTIGKNKKIKHGQKVLIAFSGGRKSAALLHMTKKALDSASAKQLSFVPAVIFIDDSVVVPSENIVPISHIMEELTQFGYPVYVSSLEMVYRLNEKNDFYWIFDKTSSWSDLDKQIELKNCMHDMSLSAKLDFIKHLRLLLMSEIANSLGYDYLFIGDSASSLAVNLLNDINFGRGSQISADTTFYDSRYKVPLCRPLREFLDKEIALYNHLHECQCFVVPDMSTMTDEKSSIQRLSETFISNLQKDFPATIFTIFRTGGKLSRDETIQQSASCILCKSKLDNRNPEKCSALEALHVSEKLSQVANSQDTIDGSNCSDKNDVNDILQFLCHGCSIPFRAKKDISHFPLILPKHCELLDRSKMKEEIKEFLLCNDES